MHNVKITVWDKADNPVVRESNDSGINLNLTDTIAPTIGPIILATAPNKIASDSWQTVTVVAGRCSWWAPLSIGGFKPTRSIKSFKF